MICRKGASFRDAVSVVTWRSWVLEGSIKSKAPLSGRSQAFLRTQIGHKLSITKVLEMNATATCSLDAVL